MTTEPAPHRIEPTTQAAPPPPAGPSGVSAALDRDELLRVEALRAAAARLAGTTTMRGTIPDGVIDVARAFEAYLRGDQ